MTSKYDSRLSPIPLRVKYKEDSIDYRLELVNEIVYVK